jgi:hypothetical protein
MKKFLIGLIGVALLGANPVLAQAPMTTQNAFSGNPAAAPMAAAPYYGPANPVAMPPYGQPCGPTCCAPAKAECVPEHYIKKTTKVVYAPHGCEGVCVPYYCHGSLFGHCDCDEGHCECPYHRRYMIIKIKTCEEDAIKCVPVGVPDCGHHH